MLKVPVIKEVHCESLDEKEDNPSGNIVFISFLFYQPC